MKKAVAGAAACILFMREVFGSYVQVYMLKQLNRQGAECSTVVSVGGNALLI